MGLTFTKPPTLDTLVSEVRSLQIYVMALTDEVIALRKLMEKSED